MAALIRYATFDPSFVALASELNNLANNGIAVSGTIFDNSASKNTHCLVELVSAYGGTPAAQGTVDVYAVPSLDGVNFDVGAGGSIPPSDALLLATFQPTTAAAQRFVHRAELITPGLYKIVAVNRTAQIMSASGNTVSIRPFSDEST